MQLMSLLPIPWILLMCLSSQPPSVSWWGDWENLLGVSACTVMASAFSIKRVYLSVQITSCKISQWLLIILRIESNLPGLNNSIHSHVFSLLISFFSFLFFSKASYHLGNPSHFMSSLDRPLWSPTMVLGTFPLWHLTQFLLKNICEIICTFFLYR